MGGVEVHLVEHALITSQANDSPVGVGQVLST